MILFLGKYSKHIAAFILYSLLINMTNELKAAIAGWNSGPSYGHYAKSLLPVADNDYLPNAKRLGRVLPGSVSSRANFRRIGNQLNVAPAGGPTQPEMQSFKSANANNLVDLFSGDFSYNVPLMDVGGYPVSLHYNSGISMDQESSWVGLGWNVNPGAVTRTMRGLPDDFNGADSVTKIQSIKENKTVSVNGDINIELFGNSNLFQVSLGATLGVLYNNYTGWGVETGLSPSISTTLNSGGNSQPKLTAGLSITSNSMYGLNISPSLSFSLDRNEKPGFGASIGTNYNNRSGISALQLHAEVRQGDINYSSKVSETETKNTEYKTHGASGVSTSISFAVPSYLPTINMPFINNSFSFTGKVGFEGAGLRPGFGITGSVQTQKLAYKKKTFPAFGYIYHNDAKNVEEALLDYNREKEIAFNYATTPHIAIPSYTYDAFNITGEGIGGMFRAYRSDVGFVRDHKMQTKSGTDNLSLDLGFGSYFHGGTDLMKVDASTTNRAWSQENDLLPKVDYTSSDSTYESVYFKNPGEQTVADTNFINAIGGDKLVRAKLAGVKENIKLSNQLETFSNARSIGTVLVNEQIVKKQRDKRTQLITCLTAKEANLYGLDKSIRSYPENVYDTGTRKTTFQVNLGNACLQDTININRVSEYRKPNHISEIDVLNADGKKYVYGLPVYNKEQREVSFNVDMETRPGYLSKGWTKYTSDADGTDNDKGKDGFFSENITPAYAHSFLLTGILSPDYVDIRNDGITDDDLGDAIKFNYTEVAGNANPFKWRIPYSEETNVGNYNEGLRSYSRDDKASFIYGEKELWYLNTIESKNMVAVFSVSRRYDQVGVLGRSGGLDTAKATGRLLRKLDRIDLYAKADLIKNGQMAKPIKTVRFQYEYSLCKGMSVPSTLGKLTLKKIWFSYNGGKERKPYIFNYDTTSVYNPNYNPSQYDRWGNYKNPSSNPGGLNNYDYPYTEQDSVKAAKNVAAWHLNGIQLPAGGRIGVTYESDDYGYVQNKRATQFFALAGFGNIKTSNPDKYMYDGSILDRSYAFIDLPVGVTNDAELKERYLKGIDTLFFKLFVAMPNNDKWLTSSPYEWVPVYTSIDSCGLVPGNNNRAWIKVRDINGGSPFAKVAIQFLRLNLPSKAYPKSETGSNVQLTDMIKALFASLNQYTTMFKSFESIAMKANWAKEVALNRSFVRLNSPIVKKLGGGIRVKRVEMWDNWKAMTGTMKEASYGKEYTYTTTEDLNGKPALISSGVASFEPGIGGDENPFHIAKELLEKTAALAPTNLMFSEEPLGEEFFPSSMIGYSQVKVRTIHTKAKSANGWDMTQFYTSKDFPVLTEYTPLDEKGKQRFKPFLNSFFKFNAMDYVSITQGFKVELNDMNGKIKAEASFPENDPENPVRYTKYFYKVDDPTAAVQHLNNDVDVVLSKDGVVQKSVVGKEVEMMVDFREQYSKTTSVNIGLNVDVIPAFAFPLPIPSRIPFPQSEVNRFRSSAIVKVINRHAILDSIVHIDKGSVVSTKNLVWDGESGEVIVTRTNNEFNDPVFQFSYPAYWAYEGMGAAYSNIGLLLANKGLKIVRGKLFGPDGQASYLEKYFRSGDEIYIEAQHAVGATAPFFAGRQAAPIVSCQDPVWQTGPLNFGTEVIRTPDKIWAISAEKGRENHAGIYFIDKEGKPFNGRNFTAFKIIRSGNRNMTVAGAGAIVSLKTPLRVANGVRRILIDSLSEVLNATTNTYNDLWKVNNHYYIKDTAVKLIIDSALVLFPKRVFLMQRAKYSSGEKEYYPFGFTNKGTVAASSLIQQYKSGKMSHYDTKTIVDFDIVNQIQKAVSDFRGRLIQLNGASLLMYGKNPANVWYSDARNIAGLKDRGGFPNPWPRDGYNSHFISGTLDGASNNATIKNIRTNDWNYNSKYTDNYILSNASINIPAAGTTFVPPTPYNATSLVIDAINTKSYGFMVALAQEHTGTSKTSDRTISYCEGPETNCGPLLTVNIRIEKDTTYQLCKLFINDSVINPYRFGILGNWRTDKGYVYYSKRDGRIDAGLEEVAVNLRKGGILKGFQPFWNFTASDLQPTSDTSKWTWTSVQSIFNKKGFEIENFDALDRHNSGLYGYNEQLPVAVAQNATSREIFYDGLEDYAYNINACNELCKDPRMFDGFSISSADSHTGKNALSLLSNQSKVVTIPLTNREDTAASLSIQVDSTENYKTYVYPRGTGLIGNYTLNGMILNRIDPVVDINWLQSPVPFNWNGKGYMSVGWSGKIQVAVSDNYQFYLQAGTGASFAININGNLVVSSSFNYNTPVFLEAGKLYTITMAHKVTKYGANNSILPGWNSSVLKWTREGNPSALATTVPSINLYPGDYSLSDTAGSVVSNLVSYCVTLNNIKPQKVILPKLAPVKGSEVVIGIWVKMKGDHNNTMAFDPVPPIGIGFDGANAASDFLLPTGVRIEGWQRYELVKTIPANASSLKLFFKSGSVEYLYDDFRIHPFNANMKSFVYDPVSLRLVADLDENNYAGFYEYDNEGVLMRVKKETERGIKTLNETKSSLLKTPQ